MKINKQATMKGLSIIEREEPKSLTRRKTQRKRKNDASKENENVLAEALITPSGL
jgi:hypothetical protein